MELTPKHPDDPDRELSEYAKAAWIEAEKFYSELANRFPRPPELPDREEPQIQSYEELADVCVGRMRGPARDANRFKARAPRNPL
jgi:hypothetical protein